MLRHQFGQDLVLDPNLLLQIVDPFLLRRMVGSRLGLEDGRSVVKNLLGRNTVGWSPKLSHSFEIGSCSKRCRLRDGDVLVARVVLLVSFSRGLSVILTLDRPPHFLTEAKTNASAWVWGYGLAGTLPIAATTTQSGLRVRAALDRDQYPTGVQVSDEQLAKLSLRRHSFHGEWNYDLLARPAIV